ncbi:MAG: LLM class flavin-dependent oxidoreductase, partial [Actinomycetota bacterium]|nr:LLM class flavin-dependent oxidoreductase [Actinomycetota bacterium]
MKVRIGFGFGVRTKLNDTGFGEVVDALEELRFDSLWLSERLGGEAPDPLVAMAFAAGRTTKLKFGMSVMVLPGRNPVVLAKELATLDRMSGGRLLPAFGLGAVDPHDEDGEAYLRCEVRFRDRRKRRGSHRDVTNRNTRKRKGTSAD